LLVKNKSSKIEKHRNKLSQLNKKKYKHIPTIKNRKMFLKIERKKTQEPTK